MYICNILYINMMQITKAGGGKDEKGRGKSKEKQNEATISGAKQSGNSTHSYECCALVQTSVFCSWSCLVLTAFRSYMYYIQRLCGACGLRSIKTTSKWSSHQKQHSAPTKCGGALTASHPWTEGRGQVAQLPWWRGSGKPCRAGPLKRPPLLS